MIPAQGTPSEGPMIKICGLERPEDVLLAAELGAWALGFVFTPGTRSPMVKRVRRMVRELHAQHPVSRPLTVGVFANSPPEEIERIREEAGLDGVQLGGEESPFQIRRVRDAVGKGLLIKVVSVEHGTASAASISARVQSIAPLVDVVLLDTKVRNRIGGTGLIFHWELARSVTGMLPILLAGGITPYNVKEALQISGAWGIDVSSEVESAPGVKDPDLMRLLFREARGTVAMAGA